MAFPFVENAFFGKFGTLHIKTAQNRSSIYYLEHRG